MYLLKYGVVAAALLPFTASAGDVQQWKVLPEKSTIQWTVAYSGKQIDGDFPAFTSDIRFDPAHLNKSSVAVAIETAKVRSGDKDAQDALPGSEWLDVSHYPLASFKATGFRKRADGQYEASGDLNLHGKTVKTLLPFSLKINGHHAVMDATATLKRLDFGVGGGEWAKTDVVGNDVKVTIHVEAESN